MICQKQSIILANTSHLWQALIAVEKELFAQVLQLLRFLRQHVPERLFFVQKQLLFPPY